MNLVGLARNPFKPWLFARKNFKNKPEIFTRFVAKSKPCHISLKSIQLSKRFKTRLAGVVENHVCHCCEWVVFVFYYIHLSTWRVCVCAADNAIENNLSCFVITRKQSLIRRSNAISTGVSFRLYYILPRTKKRDELKRIKCLIKKCGECDWKRANWELVIY